MRFERLGRFGRPWNAGKPGMRAWKGAWRPEVHLGQQHFFILMLGCL